MSKKSASARHGAQRNRPKVQKSFELVRPGRVEVEEEEGSSTTSAKVAVVAEESKSSDIVSAVVGTKERSKPSDKAATTFGTKEEVKSAGKVDELGQESPIREEREVKTEERQNTSAPGSASARLAARRQAALKLQQRSAAVLITSEHFAYVRRDLIKIAVFAVLMFTAIIVLYLTLGRP